MSVSKDKDTSTNKKFVELSDEDDSDSEYLDESSESESEPEDLVSADTDNKDVNIVLSKKEMYIYMKLRSFYRTVSQANIDLMMLIISEQSNISLRKLDWFATKYFLKNYNNKKKGPFKKKDDDGNMVNFNVYISYKAELDSYKKKNFDPFKRRRKFYFNYDSKNPSKTFVTNICQLNFFRWVFEHNILKYVEDNLADITEAMSSSKNEDKEKKKKKISAIAQKNKIKSKIVKSTLPVKHSVAVDNKNASIKNSSNITNNKIIVSFE